MKPLTYRETGVDIDAGDDAVRRITPLARATNRAEVIGGVGGFASLVGLPSKYREPVMVSSTDGVGSKLKIACLTGRHDTVGIDLVAMGVNDILVPGAEPLYFLDYISVGRVDPGQIESIVGGVAERQRLIDGSRIRPGDAVLGLASSGLHSNGYSLARRIVFDILKLRVTDALPGTGRTVADELLEPTRIYVRSIQRLLETVEVRGMAHVTGGGLTGNIPRVLPHGCRARLVRGSWSPPPVFDTLRQAGRVEDAEMFRTFNMGIGYVVIVPVADADAAARILRTAGETVTRIGEIVAGERGVELVA